MLHLIRGNGYSICFLNHPNTCNISSGVSFGVFYMTPTTLVQSFANLDHLKKKVPSLSSLIKCKWGFYCVNYLLGSPYRVIMFSPQMINENHKESKM